MSRSDLPTLRTAFLSHRLVGTLIVAAFVALAYLASVAAPSNFTATAEILFEDPGTADELDLIGASRPSRQPSTRFVENRLEILSSYLVAEKASGILSGEVSADSIVSNSDVERELGGHLVQVSYESSAPEKAKRVVDALAAAFLEVEAEIVAGSAAQSVEALRRTIETIDNRMQEIDAQLEMISAEEADGVQARFDALDQNLTTAMTDRLDDPASEILATEIVELRAALRLEPLIFSPGSAAQRGLLEEERSALGDLRAALSTRVAAAETAVDLPVSSVVMVSPALVPEMPSFPTRTFIAGFIVVIGLGLASSVTFFLEVRQSA